MGEMNLLGPEPVEVPGEVVVSLKHGVGASLAVSVSSGPSRGAAPGVSSLGSSGLDAALSKLKVIEVRKVHSPLPPAPRGVMAADVDATLESTFRVRFAETTKVSTAVNQLGKLDEVEYAEPVLLREASIIPNDPLYPQQWGLAKIRCPEAWDRTTGDPGVIVAVVDTGVDLDHPELSGLLLPGYDMVDYGPNPGPPMPGWVWEGDFNGRDNIPQDEVGHGTHVAGTIACRSNDGIGVAGVTWNTRILPVKVLNRARRLSDNRISGFGSSVDIAAGIRWAADHGARIINLSLGGPGNDQVTADAVAYAISRGCLVVAAMGNTGNAVPQFPAALPGVLAVAAVDINDARASFSSMGSHVGISGPGVGILSTYWDNTRATLDGTSMASPHVAGVAALLLSCKPSLTAAQVRQALISTARPLKDSAGDPVPNDRYGAGLVDAKKALDSVCSQSSRPVIVCAGPRTTAITCNIKSMQVVCQTQTVVCTKITKPVICDAPPLSQLIVCEVVTRTVTCVVSQQVACVLSQQVICDAPSVRVVCQSLAACPSGPVCGRPDFPIRPELGEDPYGDDPYGTDYGGQG